MKRYVVVFSKTAEKDIEKLPAKAVEKIIPIILLLEENPRPVGCKNLKDIRTYGGYVWATTASSTPSKTKYFCDIREIGDRKDIYQ